MTQQGTERAIAWSLRMLGAAPWIVVLLTVLEALSLWFIDDLKIFGLSATSWRFIEAINRFRDGESSLSQVPVTWYNGLGFLGDWKKIVPYGLAFAWFMVFREAVGQCCRTVPRQWSSAIVGLHAVLGLGLIIFYCATQLIGNEHEHWFGTSRIGLLSVAGWLSEAPDARPSLVTIVAVVFYRLTYSVNITMIIWIGTFTVALLTSSLVAGARSRAGERLWDSLTIKARERWRRHEGQPEQGLPFFHWILVALILAGGSAYWFMYSSEGAMPAGQFGAALVVLLVLCLPASVYLYLHRRKLSRIQRVSAALVIVPACLIWGKFIENAGSFAYDAARGTPDRITTGERQLVGKLATGLSTFHGNDGWITDRTRRLWEQLTSKTGSDRLATQAIYLLWACRLQELDSLCVPTGVSLHPFSNADLVRIAKRPWGHLSSPYEWSERRREGPSWRWWRSVDGEVRRTGVTLRTVLGTPQQGSQDEYIGGILGREGLLGDSTVAISQIRRDLILGMSAAGSPDTVAVSSEVESVIRQYLSEISQHAIGRTNLEHICAASGRGTNRP